MTAEDLIALELGRLFVARTALTVALEAEQKKTKDMHEHISKLSCEVQQLTEELTTLRKRRRKS